MPTRGLPLALLLVMLAAPSFVAVAQTGYWRPPSGPATAEITAFESARSGALLAGTVRGLYRSIDDGASWTLVAPPLAGGVTRALLRTGAGTMIASGPSATLRSTDDGATWLVSPLPDSTVRSFSSLMLDSAGAVFGCSAGRLYRSTDDGLTWTWTTSAFDSFASVNADLLTIDATTRLITDGRFTYRSVDAGLSWSMNTIESTESAWDIARAAGGDVLVIARRPRSWGTVAFRSVDGGVSWAPAIDGMDTTAIWSLRNGVDGEVLAVSTAGTLRWDESTSTWTQHAAFATATLGAIYHVRDTLLYSAGVDGISLSFDQGRGWSATGSPAHALVNAIAIDSAGSVYASSGYSIYRSTDLGETWSRTGFAGRDAILAVSARGTLVAAATQNGLVAERRIGISTDAGATWSSMANPRGRSVSSFVGAPDGTLFASGYDEIIRSTDDGLTWQSIAPDSLEFPHRTLTLSPDGELFIATGNGGIIRSVDAGTTWSEHARTSLRYFESMVAIGGGDLVIGAYAVPVQRYRHANATVESLGAFSPTDSTVAYGLAIGGTRTLFARTLRGRIYGARLDAPGSWTDLSNGLAGSATTLAVHPAGYLFAGVGGAGVQRTADAIATTPEQPARATSIAMHALPQPARDAMTLAFALERGGVASIVISDVDGRVVATVPDAYFGGGEHRVVVPVDGLASGVYVAELRGEAPARVLVRIVR